MRQAGSYLGMVRGRIQPPDPDSESDIDPKDLVGRDVSEEEETSDVGK